MSLLDAVKNILGVKPVNIGELNRQATHAPVRSKSQFEVDFILGGHMAIVVMAAHDVSSRDLKGLKVLSEDGLMKRLLLVCQEPVPRRMCYWSPTLLSKLSSLS